MTEKTTKIKPEHKDKLGRAIEVEMHVAYPSSNRLRIGRVTKLSPKMISVTDVDGRHSTKHIYPADSVLVDSSRVTFYVLQK